MLTKTERDALEWLVVMDAPFRSEVLDPVYRLLCRQGLARAVVKPTGTYFKVTAAGRMLFNNHE